MLWRVPQPLSGPLDAVVAVTRNAHLEGVVAKSHWASDRGAC